MRSSTDQRLTSSTGAPKRGKPARRGARPLFLVLISALALAACDGGNVFSGGGGLNAPAIITLSSLDGPVVHDTVTLRVDAAASRGVARLVLTIEGALARDTTVIVSPPQAQVSRTIRVAMPLLSDTLLRVRATAVDAQGVTSPGRTLQLVAFGPPSVTALNAPAAVRPGEVINVGIVAAGTRRIASIALRVRGALNKDTAVAVQPPQRNTAPTITFQIPVTALDTMLKLSVTAWDETGGRSSPRDRDVPLVIDPPVLSLIAPLEARAGDRMDLDIQAISLRKVAQIRVQLRGAVVKDTTVRPDPVRTEVEQIVSILLPGGITASTLTVSAWAIDGGGVAGITHSRDVEIPIGPPTVTDVEVPGGVFTNSVADVRVVAQGLRPIARIDVRFRGAIDADQTFILSPQRHDVVQDASILVPAVPKDVVLIVHVTATDVAGEVSAIVTRVIPVTALAEGI